MIPVDESDGARDRKFDVAERQNAKDGRCLVVVGKRKKDPCLSGPGLQGTSQRRRSTIYPGVAGACARTQTGPYISSLSSGLASTWLSQYQAPRDGGVWKLDARQSV